MGKRKDLINSYEQFKLNSFYGIGQRKAKLFMNARIKELNKLLETSIGTEQQTIITELSLLKFFRYALECENCNINAKKYLNTDSFSYQDNNYERKHALIKSLMGLAEELKLTYGYTNSDVRHTSHIVYFDLPETGEQISFHETIPSEIIETIPIYPKEWDQQQNSTLPKIEKAFCHRYGNLLKNKYKLL